MDDRFEHAILWADDDARVLFSHRPAWERLDRTHGKAWFWAAIRLLGDEGFACIAATSAFNQPPQYVFVRRIPHVAAMDSRAGEDASDGGSAGSPTP
jgi:hypothetical protein